jgi:hypothetical protein
VGRKRSPKCLVIDTDIARAAGGGNTQREPSKSCRVFMDTMLDHTQHKVVLTRAIQEEWNKHQSIASLNWRATMIAQKRVCLIRTPVNNELRQKVEQCASSDNKRKAMLKDFHLVEAAYQADKIVISMDETIRNCFREITHKIRPLAFIAWVNPCISEETPVDWLKNGAELERERLLGYRREGSATWRINKRPVRE